MYAIAFLSTPHIGEDRKNWELVLRRVFSLVGSPDQDIPEPTFRMLASVQQEFSALLNSRSAELHPMQIFCFYEEIEMPGIGEVGFSYSST